MSNVVGKRGGGGGGGGGGSGSATTHHYTVVEDVEMADKHMNGNGTSDCDSPQKSHHQSSTSSKSSSSLFYTIRTSMKLRVLILLAVQNSSKNLLMRFVMKTKPQFLTSAAVIGSECMKFTLSVLYILFVERKSLASIFQYVFSIDKLNTLLVVVPASAYNLQMTLEYVALANIDAANFSVLVQTKLLCTATFAALVLRKKLKYIQVISLILLTVGVMLCNMKFDTTKTNKNDDDDDDDGSSTTKGILATLGIAVSSGFASVYTEKVIKTARLQQLQAQQQAAQQQKQASHESSSQQQVPSSSSLSLQHSAQEYGLAYTQVQLATMSLVTIGMYACINDFQTILEYGLWYKFNFGALLTVFNSAIGGLIVAAVLKYADSVLKGYATAISVIVTGIMSMILFDTHLHTVYFLGIINVVIAVILYNSSGSGKDGTGNMLDQYMC